MDEEEAVALVRRLRIALAEYGMDEIVLPVRTDDQTAGAAGELEQLIDRLEDCLVHVPKLISVTMRRLSAETLTFRSDSPSEFAMARVVDAPTITHNALNEWSQVAENARQVINELRNIIRD